MSFLGVLALCAVLRGAVSSPVAGKGSREGEMGESSHVTIQWSRTGVQNYTVDRPLVVFLGQTLVIECPQEAEGQREAVFQLLGPASTTALLAEKCRDDDIAVQLNMSQIGARADCVQDNIHITKPDYVPGETYHFASLPSSLSPPNCSFAMSILVRQRGGCPSVDETDCEPTPSPSVPVTTPTVTPSSSVSSPASSLQSSPSPTVTVTLCPSPSPEVTVQLMCSSATTVSARPSALLILSLLISIVVWWR